MTLLEKSFLKLFFRPGGPLRGPKGRGEARRAAYLSPLISTGLGFWVRIPSKIKYFEDVYIPVCREFEALQRVKIWFESDKI